MKSKKNPGIIRYEAVVVGVSSGGMEVLSTILPQLPDDFKLPIIIVQHMHSSSDNYFAKSLDKKCQISVMEACEKDHIKGGTVYIAPPNYHLLIELDRTFTLEVSPRVNYARPSIDVLFESAVDVYGNRLIGIILTGANFDGCQGLKLIKERGGVAVVQDPETAQADSMPRQAIAVTKVDHVLPPNKIAALLLDLSGDKNRSKANKDLYKENREQEKRK